MLPQIDSRSDTNRDAEEMERASARVKEDQLAVGPFFRSRFIALAFLLTGLPIVMAGIFLDSELENEHLLAAVRTVVWVGLTALAAGLLLFAISARKRARTRAILEPSPDQMASFAFDWSREDISVQRRTALFRTRGGCVYCGQPEVREERAALVIGSGSVRGAVVGSTYLGFVGSLIGSVIGGVADSRRASGLGVPPGVEVVEVGFEVCERCKPSLRWVWWIAAAGIGIMVAMMLGAALLAPKHTKPTAIQLVATFLPAAIGGALFWARCRVRGFPGPVTLTLVPGQVQVQAPRHIWVSPTKLHTNR